MAELVSNPGHLARVWLVTPVLCCPINIGALTEGNTRGLVLVKNPGGGRFRRVGLSPLASLEGCEGAGLAKGIPGPEQRVGAPEVGKNLGEIEGQWGGHHS